MGLKKVLATAAVFFSCAGTLGAEPKVQPSFQTWLEDSVWPRASIEGVSRSVFNVALGDVKLNRDLPGTRQPKSTSSPEPQRQAEFSSPSRYFRPETLEWTTQTGQQIAKDHASTLRKIEQETGVPGRIALAIWGRESSFGQARMKYDAFEVLASKGYLDRRSEYFTRELIAALKIAEAGHVSPKNMKTSWAGAMGQPQFMPSNFLRYAVDGSGDGRADIWGSEADTLASIAAYLSEHGWQRGRDWGFEINLPASVSCSLEGRDMARPIRDWTKIGITRVSGRPFPAHELDGDAYLMLPAGRLGPAFLVTPNFNVIKAYNRSDLYALFIGHIGDRIQFDMGDFKGNWSKIDDLYRSDVETIQNALVTRGMDVGGADGLAGAKTRRSIGKWQNTSGQKETCFPSHAALASLQE